MASNAVSKDVNINEQSNPKQQKITDAAYKLFMRHSYRKVTMSDIAEASEMSRPSLYAVFANKEAVLTALIDLQIKSGNEAHAQLDRKKTLKDKLSFIFDIWIITPFESVINSENGIELIKHCADYVPNAVTNLYANFEKQIIDVLEPEISKKSGISAEDIAHIMMLATRGLKASTDNLPELKRLTNGLIAMTLAAVK